MPNSRMPVITDMQVIPVAGQDSMLLSLSGAHSPWFTRNLVLLTDSAGHTGIGEVHGGATLCTMLENLKPLVIGTSLADYRNTLQRVAAFRHRRPGDTGEGIQSLDISQLKFVVRPDTAIEAALLDLYGQFVELPVCALLGDGQQHEEITILAYLFYVADKSRTDLPYLDESDSPDRWFSLRRGEAMTPEAIVRQAETVQEKYGFHDFKLKGGVLAPEVEARTIELLKARFPDARVNIDPNGAWPLATAIEMGRRLRGVLTYAEDPCGTEAGYSGRETMAEFKMRTGIPTATNMIATDWRQFYHAIVEKSVDIVLADPHFWTMSGSVRMGQILHDWSLTWGCHSNNHFDISLAIFCQTAAACPGEITPLDTHWIWQDGQDLCDHDYKIVDGKISIPKKPGLGLTPNMDKIRAAHEYYLTLANTERDDALGMRFYYPDWKYDSKRPCMVR